MNKLNVFLRKMRARLNNIFTRGTPPKQGKKILFISNSNIPTLQLSFLKPLAAAVANGKYSYEIITEQNLKDLFGKNLGGKKAEAYLIDRARKSQADVAIFCRYSGPHAAALLKFFTERSIPSIYHIDDDLLNIPLELGKKKYEYHNHPARKEAVRYLLNYIDLIYCSNQRLAQRLKQYGIQKDFYSGDIYASGNIINKPEIRLVCKIGYMGGIDHAHDLEIIVTALEKILDQFRDISFELFGPIPKPQALDRFGSRVVLIPPVSGYGDFMNKFSQLHWDIALCPLASIPFNMVKSNTKWVEYSSVGAAVIASKGTIYDECCANEAGILSEDHEWYSNIKLLIEDDDLRFKLLSNAQEKIASSFTEEHLFSQIERAIQLASAQVARRHPPIGGCV